MKKFVNVFLITVIFCSVALGVYQNEVKKRAVDRTKIPLKVENERDFQRWNTNIRNKGLQITPEDFSLVEENEVYNSQWIKITSIDDPQVKAAFDQNLLDHKDIPKVVFAPSGTMYLDYRNTYKDGYFPNQVHLYGLKEDKILDARILDCSERGNCYFDRAYWLDNDVFVITEWSRDISKKDETIPVCPITSVCTYAIKLHMVDLMHNKRYIYKSKTFDLNLSGWIQNL
ncbi:MAG: hypothetical protein ABIJ82_01595, partial [Patescibacteria group bacterium]